MNVVLDAADHETATPAPAAATAAPALPRRNLYAHIHKALRAFMADTLVRIGRLDIDDAADRDEGLAQLEALLQLCETHVQHENAHLHTAIEARAPAGSARIASEHVEHLEAIAALRIDAAALIVARPGTAAALQHRLYRHLALFVAENLEHMNLEETAHNALLWQHYSDDELDAIEARLHAGIPPGEMLHVLGWMLPALPPADRAGIVTVLRARVPAPAFHDLLATCRARLDAGGWRKLCAALGGDPASGL